MKISQLLKWLPGFGAGAARPGREPARFSFARLREMQHEVRPSSEQIAVRLQSVERDVILPVKWIYLIVMGAYLITPMFNTGAQEAMAPQSLLQQTLLGRFCIIYLLFNVGITFVLLRARSLPLLLVQRVVFASSFLDALFLGALTSVLDGFESILYWLFLGLIVRNALIIPLASTQLFLNFVVSLCYLVAGLIDQFFLTEGDAKPGDIGVWRMLEPFLMRVVLMWLLAVCCYGLQLLLEKQRRAEEEAREFASRSDQLRSAGWLAAEIAHKIKNRLSIMKNAAYSLQRAVEEKKGDTVQLAQIIREEVDRSDRIITELMGYAQLAEGKVEKMQVNEALDRAVHEVFPPGAPDTIKIERDYFEALPALLMQQRHLSEVLVNLIKNAREAFGSSRGRLLLRSREGPDQSVIVTIADDGPGIAPARLGKIFEPYFTTKEKGSGLGLPLVKHNVEMYGGRVEVESELGKGTQFTLHFPTRTFMKIQS